MAVEDAAVLAKLFSHLRAEDQISTFLHAFQDLREGRCASVVQSEQCNLYFQMLPAGPQQEERDHEMRARAARGESVFGSGEAAEQWEQLKELFGYDAEDEADDWWVKWGLLRERAKQRSLDMEGMGTHLSNIHVQ
jgi:salicylate hydroxylase